MTIKKQFLTLSGQFIRSMEVVRLIDPNDNRKTICFSIDYDYSLVPVMAYDTFGRLCRRRKLDYTKPNPLIEKHDALLSLFSENESGVKNGKIVDFMQFHAKLLQYKSNIDFEHLQLLYHSGFLSLSAMPDINYTSRKFHTEYLKAAIQAYLVWRDNLFTQEAIIDNLIPNDLQNPELELSIGDMQELIEFSVHETAKEQALLDAPSNIFTPSYGNKRQRAETTQDHEFAFNKRVALS